MRISLQTLEKKLKPEIFLEGFIWSTRKQKKSKILETSEIALKGSFLKEQIESKKLSLFR